MAMQPEGLLLLSDWTHHAYAVIDPANPNQQNPVAPAVIFYLTRAQRLAGKEPFAQITLDVLGRISTLISPI